MSQKPAIVFSRVSKLYRLQQHRTLKELLPALFKRRAKDTSDGDPKGLLRGGGARKNLWALKNVSFQIKKGETVGIIGPNGAGKSTILKLIAGVTKPTKGKITVNGRVSPLIELGAGFHPDLTGRENIYLNGAILGLPKKEIDKKFKEIVDFAELWDFIDQPVKRYSSGMYMRLGFSIAVHAIFDILLIDEILAVGDLRFQQKCFERMREIKDKKTIVFVSHDLGSIRAFCDKVFLLGKGKIKGAGNSDEMVDRYIFSQGESKEKGSEKTVSSKRKRVNKLLKITAVKFLDKKGRVKTTFLSGEKMIININYQAQKKLDNVVFGIAFYRDDGTHLYGTNSLLQDRKIKIKKGRGAVEFSVHKLPVLSGKVLVTAAIHNSAYQNYDWREKEFSFNVFQAGSSADGFVDFDAILEG